MSMLPSSKIPRPRSVRRKSKDSEYSYGSSGSDDESGTPAGTSIPHTDIFLDDHLPQEFFRQDVIKLTHELRIPGWSAVDESMAEDLLMDRISGALTNSVYRVRPPPYVKENIKRQYAEKPYHHRIPNNLLLRVYGPQIGMLIDREKELSTVAHLTRHKVGPRLIGTFINGRFEQFLNAKPLTKKDLRSPDISSLVARRMRDLHDNVPISNEERLAGPVVWQKIAKWKKIAIDQLALFESITPGITAQILGTDSASFFTEIDKYHEWIDAKFPNGSKGVNDSLVFCHNDTQYGNILRLEPPKGSPLLRPKNEHRQLVVIDFEYSGPNTRAFDIANHFCEWMSDYHHPTMSHHIWTDRYPSPEEQRHFVTSYVEHGSTDFDEEKMDKEIDELLEQVQWWKPAVSASWALWGIIQTPADQDIRMRQDFLERNDTYEVLPGSQPGASPIQEMRQLKVSDIPETEEDLFDYLQYSSEKVALFWQDLKRLGVFDIDREH